MAVLAIAATLALAMSVPPPPDPSGDYLIEGECPTPGSAYRARLAIRRSGIFHLLTWQFDDGGAVVGTGMSRGGEMVVEFRVAGGNGGLMNMDTVDDGRTWRGTWAFFHSGERCSEVWTRA